MEIHVQSKDECTVAWSSSDSATALPRAIELTSDIVKMRSPIVLLALAGAVAAQEAAAEPAVVAERPVFQPYGPASSLRAYVEQFADGFGRFSPSNAKKAAKVGDGETFSYGALLLLCLSRFMLTRVCISWQMGCSRA